MKRPIIAGNWKMFKTPSEGRVFVDEVMKLALDKEKVDVIFCPPFTALFNMRDAFDSGKHFSLGAQNCHWAENGAFTGEISVDMLKDCRVQYVILGHSERRHIFHEPDEWINRKVHSVLNGNMTPILCIGETLEQREKGETGAVLEEQLRNGLKGVDSLQNIVIAYEPVWAIGTGRTATPDQVSDTHGQVRQILSDIYDAETAENVAILYGGSVKPENAKELILTKGVDGFLIGGASLKVDSFTAIIENVESSI